MIPSKIILHHSATVDSGTVSWSAIRRYHTHELGWTAIGYHFGIELVADRYEVLLGRMMNTSGAHCKEQNMNFQSLGICFVGDFDKKPPEDSQLMVGKNLIKSLLEILELDKKDIYRHCDFAKYKSCPGKMFPFNEFVNSL